MYVCMYVQPAGAPIDGRINTYGSPQSGPQPLPLGPYPFFYDACVHVSCSRSFNVQVMGDRIRVRAKNRPDECLLFAHKLMAFTLHRLADDESAVEPCPRAQQIRSRKVKVYSSHSSHSMRLYPFARALCFTKGKRGPDVKSIIAASLWLA